MKSGTKTGSKLLAMCGAVVLCMSMFFFVNSAFAASDDAVPMVVVHFHDLDVSSPAGAATLYWRIHRAADTVCGLGENSLLLPSLARQRCAHDAEARAVAQLNIARLTAYYLTKAGNAPAVRISLAK